MDRELTYEVPFERLTKVSRAMRRQAFPAVWKGYWLWLAGFAVAYFALIFFGGPSERWLRSIGLPGPTLMVLLLVVFLGGLVVLRRQTRSQVKARADFDAAVSLRKDDGGVRIATADIEYYVKWRGISQLLLGSGGMAISHGSLLFFIPDTAFHDEAERDAFIREVYGRMSPAARERSEKRLALLLAQPPAGAAT
jgi:hypothetical protein